MRIPGMIAVAAGMVPFAAIAADAVQFTSGRWEVVTTVTSITVSGEPIPLDRIGRPPETKVTCISKEQARDPAQYFLEPDHKRNCTPTGTVSGGRVTVAGTCTDEEAGQMVVTGSGTYQSKSYDMAVKAEASRKGAPIVINTTVKGRYVGVCTGTEST